MRAALLLATCALAAACSGPDVTSTTPSPRASAGVVTTEGGAVALPSASLRYPDGSRVVRVDVDGTRTTLTEGLAAAGAPFVHHDGTKLLFVGRESDAAAYRVYECAVDGSDRRIVVDHGADCVRAAYLPDGRIAYAATLPGIGPVAATGGRAAVFVAAGDGQPGERVTFGAGLDTDPTVLTDGRILFVSWRPEEDGGGKLGLFTIHPDGTGYAPFHLAGSDVVYPRQQPDGDVRFTVLTGDDPVERVASWDAPLSVTRDAEESIGESVSLAPRGKPQGHLSSINPERPYGTVVCVDARTGSAAAAASYQIATWSGERTVLGRAPLSADGSFMARVPPDTPIVIQLFDATGTVVRQEHGPIWVRRNEARVCVGCHDDIETSPPNRRPLAVLEEPVDMTGTRR